MARGAPRGRRGRAGPWRLALAALALAALGGAARAARLMAIDLGGEFMKVRAPAGPPPPPPPPPRPGGAPARG